MIKAITPIITRSTTPDPRQFLQNFYSVCGRNYYGIALNGEMYHRTEIEEHAYTSAYPFATGTDRCLFLDNDLSFLDKFLGRDEIRKVIFDGSRSVDEEKLKGIANTLATKLDQRLGQHLPMPYILLDSLLAYAEIDSGSRDVLLKPIFEKYYRPLMPNYEDCFQQVNQELRIAEEEYLGSKSFSMRLIGSAVVSLLTCIGSFARSIQEGQVSHSSSNEGLFSILGAFGYIGFVASFIGYIVSRVSRCIAEEKYQIASSKSSELERAMQRLDRYESVMGIGNGLSCSVPSESVAAQLTANHVFNRPRASIPFGGHVEPFDNTSSMV